MATQSTANTAGSGTPPSSSSVSALLSTLIPVALQAGAFTGIFLLLRPRFKRVYGPRTYLPVLYQEEQTQKLPATKFGWVPDFRGLHDEYVLNHQSLDGYLYLRFMKMLAFICFVGSCLTWPILFPINITGGGGQSQLDLLSFSNVGPQSKNRYYAHVFVGWIFFSFVMWIITRESIYYINLRHAYLLAPFNSQKISSKTVLFTDVPEEYQSEEKLRTLFGATMRRVWLATDCSDLEDLVDERDKDAMKLESAEIKLIKTANKRRLKSEKKEDNKEHHSADAEAAIPGSQWLNQKDRPTHRLGKIPFFGKKVDTIEWSCSELKRLIPEVNRHQQKHQKFDGKLLPSLFVEFSTQQAAEAAYRRMSPKKAPHMYPRAIATSPSQIIWKNLKMARKQRVVRKIIANAFITLLIVFWAIPVAVVGAISNINYLENKVPFLSFINYIPDVILGVVTGLLPSILLAVLMALVPIICRFVAKLSGEVTLADVELKTQGWYMAFQVIQVFLITTFASGAAATVSSIINDPSSATTLLANNLPKASNFFISYIIVQGLGLAASQLANLGALAGFTILAKFLDKSPRKMFNRYITLAGLGWGSLYPKVGNLGIIAITYSIIAPLLLGFSAIGFFLLYLAVRYNSFFVLTNNIDTKGRAYGKVLQQLMTGVYLAEVCLIGLFSINTAPGPIVLMAIFLVGTAIYHAMMRHALKPLMEFLPESYDGGLEDGRAGGAAALMNSSDYKSYDASKTSDPPSETSPAADGKFQTKKAGMLAKYFDPHKFKSHQTVQALVPAFPAPRYSQEDEANAYYNPAIRAETPTLWIPRDEMGISRREIEETTKVQGLEMSDDLASFNEKNKVVWTRPDEDGGVRIEDAPIYEKRVDY